MKRRALGAISNQRTINVALQDYAQLKLFYNSNPLTQCTSLEHVTNSGQQRVDLLETGLAGFTPGSGDCEINFGYAVPIGGPEENFQAACCVGEYVDLQFFQGSLSYAGRGKIITNRVSQSTNQSVEGTVNWVGEMKPFE